VVGDADVPDSKVQHAINVAAQYLDNDGDGIADTAVACDVKKNTALLFMAATDAGSEKVKNDHTFMEKIYKKHNYTQDLWGSETHPGSNVANGDPFDATLEEVLHLITNGYAAVWPEAFAFRNSKSKLTKAMDKARGGVFEKPPKSYPSNAWYTYNDSTCDYGC